MRNAKKLSCVTIKCGFKLMVLLAFSLIKKKPIGPTKTATLKENGSISKLHGIRDCLKKDTTL